MYQSDWARLIKAGVPIETIAQVANVPTHVIEQALEAQAKQRAKVRTLQEMQPAGPETPARKKPGKRKGRRVKNPKKTCEHCQQPFSRPKGPDGSLLAPSKFILRRYCSPVCTQAARRAGSKLVRPDSPVTKTCRNCERVFGPPYYMSKEDWARRLYCTDVCRRSHQMQIFAAARAPIPPQPASPQMALFRVLPPVPMPEPAAESDAEYLIRLCGGEAA